MQMSEELVNQPRHTAVPVDDTSAVVARFFARPEADKFALRIGQYNIGYLPFGGQVVSSVPHTANRSRGMRQ